MWTYVDSIFIPTIKTFEYERFYHKYMVPRWLTWKTEKHPDTVSSIILLGKPRLRQTRRYYKNITGIDINCRVNDNFTHAYFEAEYEFCSDTATAENRSFFNSWRKPIKNMGKFFELITF